MEKEHEHRILEPTPISTKPQIDSYRSPTSSHSSRKSRAPYSNPLQAGIATFLSRHSAHSSDPNSIVVTELLLKLPKRYTLYPPLLLLPSNVFSSTSAFKAFYAQLSRSDQQILYSCIADAFRARLVTHIAVASPIAAENPSGMSNVMRSPTGLVPVFGDWGPSLLGLDERNDRQIQVTESGFRAAFWTSTSQNGGVVQIWAPLFTMFSRGNIKEKARILGEGCFEGMDGSQGVLKQDLPEISIVDFYIGIGYFAFSYLKRGAGLVWGWEINRWSVEGLRRGCEANGWAAKVFRVDGSGEMEDEEGVRGETALMKLVARLETEIEHNDMVRCVVFWGDNRWADKIMTSIRRIHSREKRAGWKNVRHVNLGLLPSARDSWQRAVRTLDQVMGGWLHVHENVDVRAIDLKRDAIVGEVGRLVQSDKQGHWQILCCHIEKVKTYAPGVMHCVFDIQILPAR